MGGRGGTDGGFNSRLREEATGRRAAASVCCPSFNSRLREEATASLFSPASLAARFNSRLREEATITDLDGERIASFQLTPP